MNLTFQPPLADLRYFYRVTEGTRWFFAWQTFSLPKSTRRGRYPFKRYIQLVLFVALAAVMNTLFGNLLQDVVGNFNIIYDAVVTTGLIGYAFLFAFIIWRMDRSGSLGRLMGAKDAEP